MARVALPCCRKKRLGLTFFEHPHLQVGNILECPIYGNAAYVIDAEVEVWREMTKHELAESGLAQKIPHRGADWPKKVRQALDLE